MQPDSQGRLRVKPEDAVINAIDELVDWHMPQPMSTPTAAGMTASMVGKIISIQDQLSEPYPFEPYQVAIPACCQTWKDDCPIHARLDAEEPDEEQPFVPQRGIRVVKWIGICAAAAVFLSLIAAFCISGPPTPQPTPQPTAHTYEHQHDGQTRPPSEGSTAAAPGSWALMDDARDNLLHGQIKVDDNFRLMLFSSHITPSSRTCSEIQGEVSGSSDGYPTGGMPVHLVSTNGANHSTKLYFGGTQPTFNAGSAGLRQNAILLCDQTTNHGLEFINLETFTPPGSTLSISDTADNPVLTMWTDE